MSAATRVHKRRAVQGGIVAFGLFLAGCGGTNSPADRLSDLSAQFSSFSGSDAADRLWAELHESVRVCVESRGFEYFAPEAPPEPASLAPPGNDVLLPTAATIIDGWSELANATERADRGAGGDPYDDAASAEDDYLRSLTGSDRAQYEALLDGNDPQSCQYQASVRLGDDFLATAGLFDSLPVQVAERTADSDVVRRAREEVLGCLEARGIGSDLESSTTGEMGFDSVVHSALLRRAGELVASTEEPRDLADLAPFAAQLQGSIDQLRAEEIELRDIVRACGDETDFTATVARAWQQALESAAQTHAETMAQAETAIEALGQRGG